MPPGQTFVLMIIGMAMIAGIVRQIIRAKYNYHPDSKRAARRGAGQNHHADELAVTRKIELLSSENDRLNGQIARLEERLRVVERIVTDPADRTSREIDALRDAAH
ncbi:hypothetical protein [Stakelama pacifica]|uniref:Phage shock protein B n=1 Tax=Stakelama pacifica TaxID=517720 RepID=A0A4R6FF86_9SPHN|nr:hypothetical protein [Stakelama pacifica]TDN79912.1 hypothetical protein EV664_11169 [Stakelama pacifica]GGO98191.1 hypothetical protein GCM10011329_28770 [Stakelama pacifica]